MLRINEGMGVLTPDPSIVEQLKKQAEEKARQDLIARAQAVMFQTQTFKPQEPGTSRRGRQATPEEIAAREARRATQQSQAQADASAAAAEQQMLLEQELTELKRAKFRKQLMIAAPVLGGVIVLGALIWRKRAQP